MAQNNLGMLYHAGKGVPVDYLKAIKWYNQAAQKGLPDAQNNLAIMFAFGKGGFSGLLEGLCLAHRCQSKWNK